MEDLYVENFSKHEDHSQPVSDMTSVLPSEIVRNNNLPQKKDILFEMSAFLDRLEKEIEKEYLDFADYRFTFNKIRKELKKESVEGVVELLDKLEELLDLGLPSIILRRNSESN